jgi:hypothetical protein
VNRTAEVDGIVLVSMSWQCGKSQCGGEQAREEEASQAHRHLLPPYLKARWNYQAFIESLCHC